MYFYKLFIISLIGSPLYNVSTYVTKSLEKFTKKNLESVLNSSHFSLISNMVVEPNDLSLFTRVSIPYSRSFELNWKISSTYFLIPGKFYQQTAGVPMGSFLPPVLANIFLETVILESSRFKPRLGIIMSMTHSLFGLKLEINLISWNNHHPI